MPSTPRSTASRKLMTPSPQPSPARGEGAIASPPSRGRPVRAADRERGSRARALGKGPEFTRGLSRGALKRAVAGRTLVLKEGGSLGGEDTLPEDVSLLQELGARLVLVHGGGPLITEWLSRVGKETRFVEGLRYTDRETLQVVRMVLGGLVNGEVVARIGAAGGRAIGISGADDRLLVARPRAPELGLVGEISQVNPRPIQVLLEAGYVVVLAPVAVSAEGDFLNVNADTVAGEVAAALGADHLIFLTDVDGISDERGPRRRLPESAARDLIASGTITGGMIPKVEACLQALFTVRRAQILDGRRPHGMLRALAGDEGLGTVLVADDGER